MFQPEAVISLARMYYPVTVLGPGKRVGIWLTGCGRACPGCISPELRPYDPDKEIPVHLFPEMLKKLPAVPDGFTISGGEPFYHPESLHALVETLEPICDDILIFTGFTLDELQREQDPDTDFVLSHCAAIIDGPYEKNLNDGKGLRGSSNQRIHVFKFPEKYAGAETAERQLQTVLYRGNMLTLGIPGGN